MWKTLVSSCRPPTLLAIVSYQIYALYFTLHWLDKYHVHLCQSSEQRYLAATKTIHGSRCKQLEQKERLESILESWGKPFLIEKRGILWGKGSKADPLQFFGGMSCKPALPQNVGRPEPSRCAKKEKRESLSSKLLQVNLRGVQDEWRFVKTERKFCCFCIILYHHRRFFSITRKIFLIDFVFGSPISSVILCDNRFLKIRATNKNGGWRRSRRNSTMVYLGWTYYNCGYIILVSSCRHRREVSM